MGSFEDLLVYKKSFELAMQIFEITKTFPTEEKYSLTSQIRRSSRSVTINFTEGYHKRQYPAHFTSKISDADSENTETLGWLNFSLACKYINEADYAILRNANEEIGRLLGDMLRSPEKYGAKQQVN